MDFSKLYCPLHSQLITNFCNKQQCQMGLCANCVCIHTANHLKNGTTPSYQNIKTTYSNLIDMVNLQTQKMELIKNRISQVAVNIKESRQNLKQSLANAKRDTIQLVTSFYAQREKQLIAEMNMSDKKLGLHCQNRLKNLFDKLNNEINNILSVISSVNSCNFLQLLPKIKMQQLHNSHVLCSQISSQVTQNQCYYAFTNYNKNSLNQIFQLLSKIVQLRITINDQNNHQPPPRLDSKSLRVSNNLKLIIKQAVKPNNSAVEQIKLFTLRKQDSHRNTPANQINQRSYSTQKLKNTFQNTLDENQNKSSANILSRLTIPNKTGIQEQQSTLSYLNILDKTENIKDVKESQGKSFKDKKDMILKQLENKSKQNYNFTFGNQNHDPNPFKSYLRQNGIGVSRVSQYAKPQNNRKSYSPCLVSDIQNRQFNNNIKKMESKSRGLQASRQNSFEPHFQQDNSSNLSRQLMYRTQFL